MIISPAFARIQPSYVSPDPVINYNQASGAFSLLASGDPLIRLGRETQYVYVPVVDMRGRVAVGQTYSDELPGIAITLSQISTPAYLYQVDAQYNHHDSANMAMWNLSIDDGYRLAMRQSMFLQARDAILYGINPAGGEGILNARGIKTISMPADSNGNVAIASNYDSGELAVFFLQCVNDAYSRTYQSGMPQRCVILGPQRILNHMRLVNIVHLTDFQRAGAGSASTGQMIGDVLMSADITTEWAYDDTLEGKGDGGSDAVIVTFPEIKSPKKVNPINTNVFSDLANGLTAANAMFCDMAAPTEIRAPLARGALDILSEWRLTSGWAIRPEATTILSIQYEASADAESPVDNKA